MKTARLHTGPTALAGLCLVLLASACGPDTAPDVDVTRVSEALGGEAGEGYARADRHREFRFPEDHGPHADFRNEWWYLTGNLDAEDGSRYGFQLTLFRIALSPHPRSSEPTGPTSAWGTRQVWMGHFAVTDVERRRHLGFERFSRGALGLAGAQPSPLRVWLEDWSLTGGEDAAFPWRLRAAAGDVVLQLELHGLKDIVLQGDRGLSRKSAAPGNASYYYSLPRLSAAGELSVGEARHRVSGLAWLDREWSTSALGPGQSGWDWFALQLSDGRDLMFYRLRRKDGSTDPLSAGTLVSTDGDIRRLDADSVQVEVLDHWESADGVRYPAAWRLTIAGLDDPLEIRPVIADQLMETTVRYWEGAVDVTTPGDGMTGRGYVELAGYRSVK